jgi:hypothetical protein
VKKSHILSFYKYTFGGCSGKTRTNRASANNVVASIYQSTTWVSMLKRIASSMPWNMLKIDSYPNP